uniref:Uncharacterized protein n=1 Tax=Daphnia magna TaxID=35525 RepID=A0A0P5DPX6_9CRUS
MQAKSARPSVATGNHVAPACFYISIVDGHRQQSNLQHTVGNCGRSNSHKAP